LIVSHVPGISDHDTSGFMKPERYRSQLAQINESAGFPPDPVPNSIPHDGKTGRVGFLRLPHDNGYRYHGFARNADI